MSALEKRLALALDTTAQLRTELAAKDARIAELERLGEPIVYAVNNGIAGLRVDQEDYQKFMEFTNYLQKLAAALSVGRESEAKDAS